MYACMYMVCSGTIGTWLRLLVYKYFWICIRIYLHTRIEDIPVLIRCIHMHRTYTHKNQKMCHLCKAKIFSWQSQTRLYKINAKIDSKIQVQEGSYGICMHLHSTRAHWSYPVKLSVHVQLGFIHVPHDEWSLSWPRTCTPMNFEATWSPEAL